MNKTLIFLILFKSIQSVSQDPPASPVPPTDDPEKNAQEFEQYFQTEVSGKSEGVFVISRSATVYPIPDENSNPLMVLQKNQKIHAIELREDWIKIGHKEWILRKEAKSLGWKTLQTVP